MSSRDVKILVLGAALRAGSLNARLAGIAARALTAAGAEVDLATMREFDCPSFDQDVEAADGLPPGALEFDRRLAAADAFVISSPEYNASMPGVLKNVIDWTSRHRPQAFTTRHALLLSASPSMVGGNRGLWALRVPLEHLGARVYPDMFSLAQAHLMLVDDEIADAELRERFASTIAAFLDQVEAAKHYPCVRSAWVEFLGERPDPTYDRVQ